MTLFLTDNYQYLITQFAISKANSLMLNVAFMSPNNGESPAKLKNEYGFDLKMIVDVKPNF